MKIEFVAGFSPIVADSGTSQAFYRDDLGLSFEGGVGDYVYTERLDGTKHLGLWPLQEAARACFGSDTWPEDVPTPQATLEFEVDDVAGAADELAADGHRLLHGARQEPWGQTVARLLSPEGLVIGLCFTPELHRDEAAHAAP